MFTVCDSEIFYSIDVRIVRSTFEHVFMDVWPLMDGLISFGRSMAHGLDGWMYIGVLFMFLDVYVVFGRDWMELGGNWNEKEEIQKSWNL